MISRCQIIFNSPKKMWAISVKKNTYTDNKSLMNYVNNITESIIEYDELSSDKIVTTL